MPAKKWEGDWTITKISALGRPIVLSYPTNRLIVILSLLVLAGVFISKLIQAAPLLEALGAAIAAALAVFFSWSLSREIDPARDWSAFVALPFTLPSLKGRDAIRIATGQ